MTRTSDTLSGLDKAAILMLSLPEEQVSKIFKSLYNEEVQALSKHMANLGLVEAQAVEALYIEFADRVAGAGSVNGNFMATEKLLYKIFEKEKVNQIMQGIRGPAGRTMWDKLSNIHEEVLASYLKNEYPQTVAVIMSRIKPEHAAKVLAKFPNDFGMEVIARMLNMEPVHKEALDDIEKTLRGEFINNLSASIQDDPHEKMAEIFNAFDRNTEERFMGALVDKNAEAAERIKSLMFTFEDLVKLDAAGVQTIIRIADKSKLALAMKGAPEAIKTLFFSNMSERAAKLMKDEMEGMGPVKIKEVDEAQSEIVTQVKDLVDKGEIVLSSGEEEEMIE